MGIRHIHAFRSRSQAQRKEYSYQEFQPHNHRAKLQEKFFA